MMPQYEQIDLVVPTGHVNCCLCPDHRTNYVGVAYKSYRLRLVDANGLPFSSSTRGHILVASGLVPKTSITFFIPSASSVRGPGTGPTSAWMVTYPSARCNHFLFASS